MVIYFTSPCKREVAASLLSPPSPSLSPHFPLLLRKKKGLPWISPGLGISSVVRRGTSSFVDRPGSLIRGGGFKAMQCSQRAPAPTFGVPYEEPVAQLLPMCRGPKSVPHMFSGWAPIVPRLSCGVCDTSCSFNPSSPSPTGFPKLHLMFGCDSLHQFQPVAG